VTITAAGLALAPVSPTQYAIVGNRTIARSTDFTTGGDFFANTLNDELDQQTIFAQQNAEGIQRALTAPQTDPTTINMTLPRAADRANKTLAFDANGDPTFGISAADVANASTYATNAANSATAAASSASSAASSASSASGSASTATTQASNASTSATNAASSASSASTSASAASTSATNAAASASTATTQASNASTSATNAASSASSAATSATNAANSASTATTQATNAASSASSASSSATAAAASAAAAASSYDSFDDRYLGTKASDPTLDNDGNALVTGALYYNTTTQTMKVYDGANWIAATAAGTTSMTRYRYVATSGQTTFSGADANSATMSYTSNNIVVNRNGSTLDPSEYTATNGTSVVLSVAAGTGDIIDIIAFKSFTVADTVPASTGGTFNGDVKVIGNVGIGTSSPTQKLDVLGIGRVYSSVTGTPAQFITENTGSGDVYVDLRSNSALKTRLYYDSTNSLIGLTAVPAIPIIFKTTDTERMRIDSSGRLGVGATPSSWVTSWTPIDYGNSSGIASPNDGNNIICGNTYFNGSNWIRKTATYAANIECNASGKIATYTSASSTAGSTVTWTTGPYVANLGTSWTNSSDERLKDIIEPITDATNKVGQLRAVIGKFKTDPDDKRRSFLIAQDVQAVLPEAVDATDPDSLGVQYTDVIPLLVAAIKEQQALITALTARIEALENT
jgi:hypothetical protein